MRGKGERGKEARGGERGGEWMGVKLLMGKRLSEKRKKGRIVSRKEKGLVAQTGRATGF